MVKCFAVDPPANRADAAPSLLNDIQGNIGERNVLPDEKLTGESTVDSIEVQAEGIVSESPQNEFKLLLKGIKVTGNTILTEDEIL